MLKLKFMGSEMDFGDWLREERKKIGLSSQAMASKLDMTPTKYSRIETEKINPTFQVAVQICDFLNVTVEQLFATLSDQKYILPPSSIRFQSKSVITQELARNYLDAASRTDENLLYTLIAEFWTRTEQIALRYSKPRVKPIPIPAEIVEGYLTQNFHSIVMKPRSAFHHSSGALIEDIYLSGGLVTFEEAGIYLSKRSYNPKTGTYNRIGLDRIYRELKNGRYKFLELSVALELENRIEGGGRYFWAMYWEAIQFHQFIESFAEKRETENLYHLLIRLSRWYHISKSHDSTWVKILEEHITAYRKEVVVKEKKIHPDDGWEFDDSEDIGWDDDDFLVD